MMNQTPTILVAEDDPDAVVLLRDAFKHAGWPKPPISIANGEEAMAYLEGSGQFADRKTFPYPSCLLLDLNMPKINGIELLTWIRGHAVHRRLLVFVLTVNEDITLSRLVYDLSANCLLHKPRDFEGMVKMAVSLKEYIDVIQLPPLPD